MSPVCIVSTTQDSYRTRLHEFPSLSRLHQALALRDHLRRLDGHLADGPLFLLSNPLAQSRLVEYLGDRHRYDSLLLPESDVGLQQAGPVALDQGGHSLLGHRVRFAHPLDVLAVRFAGHEARSIASKTTRAGILLISANFATYGLLWIAKFFVFNKILFCSHVLYDHVEVPARRLGCRIPRLRGSNGDGAHRLPSTPLPRRARNAPRAKRRVRQKPTTIMEPHHVPPITSL